MQLGPTTLLLFLIIDPLGNLPLFLSLLRHLETRRRYRIILREMVIALVIMGLLIIFGGKVITFFSLRMETIALSGGILLLLIALRMLFPQSDGDLGNAQQEEPFLVPLAVPLIVGPAMLATLLQLTQRYPDGFSTLLLALLCSWTPSLLILLFANWCTRFIGKQGIHALERLMGLILLMMAIQMIVDSLQTILPH